MANFAHAEDVLLPVRGGETQPLADDLAHLPAADDLRPDPAIVQLILKFLRQGVLPRAGQAGEPHGESFFVLFISAPRRLVDQADKGPVEFHHQHQHQDGGQVQIDTSSHNLSDAIVKALQQYKQEVELGIFPGSEHTYHIKDEILKGILEDND